MNFAPSQPQSVEARASEYYRSSWNDLAARVDRMFAGLLAIEWVGMAILAYLRSPFVWEGTVRHWNPHFIAAVLAGPAFLIPCIALALYFPARLFTRHSIAIAQMLVSVILIGITNGRIETHFHVFGSLAFLAFYRDWRVLATASAVTVVDHLTRGVLWPQAIYGIATVSPYRWLEHAWWVLFEDVFLVAAIYQGAQDLKQLARSKSLLYEGAYHDVLTGLANRRLLAETFDSYIESDRSASSAVLFIDLDRFKQVNDVHGHTVGDKLLLQVASRLTSCLEANTLLARIGGDEFIVLLHNAAEQQALQAGSRLLQSLTQPFSIEGSELLLSATVGIGMYPEHGSTLAVLQERADQAMYSAKANGRNHVQVYSGDMTQAQPGNQVRPEHGSLIPHGFGKQGNSIETVISMAQRLGLHVTAKEGQAGDDWLLNLKCDELQGHKLSRPIPAVLVLQLLAQGLSAVQKEDRKVEYQVLAG